MFSNNWRSKWELFPPCHSLPCKISNIHKRLSDQPTGRLASRYVIQWPPGADTHCRSCQATTLQRTLSHSRPLGCLKFSFGLIPTGQAEGLHLTEGTCSLSVPLEPWHFPRCGLPGRARGRLASGHVWLFLPHPAPPANLLINPSLSIMYSITCLLSSPTNALHCTIVPQNVNVTF